VASRVTCATRIKAGRLPALRQSPHSGVGSDEGEKRKENPDAKMFRSEETREKAS
jgi:hypothetical protein